jgi:tRNA pseudouridine55 synthase
MPFFGLLNVHKPPGVTSRRVVDVVKRLVRPDKVGHAGTLDPLASGVLVIGVGQATRLVEYVQMMPKRYSATFLLGYASTTEDVEGQLTEIAGAVPPAREDLERAAAEMIGQIDQRPPDYSALKVGGRRAYALARAGEDFQLSARAVRIDRLEVTRYAYPELCLEIECGSGTYVRSLGRDLAERVGTSAVMSALVRTAIGSFSLEKAVDPAQLAPDNLAGHLLSPLLAVRPAMPECVVGEREVERLGHGLSVNVPGAVDSSSAAVDECGSLVAVLSRLEDGTYRASKFFGRA